ncbi:MULTISPECIES: cell division protein FtsA [Kosmotoga]|jgi:cell division protein FtsA|uniref:Cell division protein FtsA n=1 Tax=Kosmotoga olearia (strain ATCC BAA-1733 / DSM 21960 / TBF 19.5.1) TaxID=521045 RepID=C5CDJ4_KOSOT|nr:MULTISPECIES: cell division protein FtsA [Kosmotoga]ACR79078.1 cell division protein FtsA [Kosmotoga olearia TBF 19.5.1]MDI3524425.1 cell division protein FtsA [Kosmotoga sp.]MDK2953192.1 cell division protein FtsA [Kosmotoga sp.]OAA23781.1 cell division protein FtsA [Kosmotoga sp. DU53]
MPRGKEYTVSIDLGTNTLKGVVVSSDPSSQLQLEAYGSVKSVGLDKGEVKDAVALKQSIQKLVDDLTGQLGKKDIVADFRLCFTDGEYAVMSEIVEESISDDKPVVVTQEIIDELMAKITQDKLKDNKNIHMKYVRKYIIDDEKVVFNPVDMLAKQLKVEMVFVSSEGKSTEVFKRLFEELLGTGDFLIFPSLISGAEAVLTDTEKQHGVVCVSIGHAFSELVIYRENLPIYVSRIPLGVRHIVRDIALVLGTSLDEAERLLVTHGYASMYPPSGDSVVEYFGLDERTRKNVSVRKLSTIIYARVKELLNKIRREIQYSKANYPEFAEEGIPGGVVFTGGGAKLRGLSDTGVESLKMPVRVGTYETSFNPRIENAHDVVNDPIFSSCLGSLIVQDAVETGIEEAIGKQKRRGFADFIRSLFFGGVEDEL